MRKKRHLLALPGLILAVIVFSFLLDMLAPVRTGLYAVFAPPFVAVRQSRAWLMNQLPFIQSSQMRAELEKLEQENKQLRIEQMQDTILLQKYNTLLRELSAASSTPAVIASSVITRNVDGFSDSVLIGVGDTDGIRQGAPVIAQGTLLGFVQQVNAKTSVVRFLFAPFTEIDGVFVSLGIPVLLEGKGAGLYTTTVPRETNITEGDVIIHNFSDELIIGEVIAIEDEASNPFLELLVRSPVNVNTLTHVLVKK